MTTKPKTRSELALMVPNNGLIIELGVAAGKFAEELLTANPNAHYLGVDRWSDHHDQAEMMRAIDRLRQFRNAATSRGTFSSVVEMIPNNYADMIYVDGYAHTGQEGGQTLRDWWPKLKPGGIFAGHDYDSEYPKTVEAVDNFARENNLEIHVITEKPNCSWWTIKRA